MQNTATSISVDKAETVLTGIVHTMREQGRHTDQILTLVQEMTARLGLDSSLERDKIAGNLSESSAPTQSGHIQEMSDLQSQNADYLADISVLVERLQTVI